MKWLLFGAFALLVLAYYCGAGMSGSDTQVLANSAIGPLASYEGGEWHGELSAYPAGHGALPYYSGTTSGVLNWPGGQHLYGGW